MRSRFSEATQLNLHLKALYVNIFRCLCHVFSTQIKHYNRIIYVCFTRALPDASVPFHVKWTRSLKGLIKCEYPQTEINK